MHHDGDDVLLTADELTALAATLGRQRGPLCLLPATDRPTVASPGSIPSLDSLPAPTQAAMRETVVTLASPAKVLDVHASLADETLTRQTLAWPATAGDDLAMINGSASDGQALSWRIGPRSPFAVRAWIRDILAADAGLPTEALNVPLPTQAVVTLLAIIDHQRYARRYAELVYEPPVVSFTPREILARLEDARVQDFRWPLLFFEKLVPPGALASYTAASIAVGLEALREAELLEPLTDDPVVQAGIDGLYKLLPAGDVLADTVLHEVSKVGLAVSECLPRLSGPQGGAGIGQDIVLLVRGADRLALFFVSGTSGTVALVDPDALTTLLDGVFEMPAPEAIAASQPVIAAAAPPPAVGVAAPQFCSRCGARIKPGSRFCSGCGAPVTG
ncbi:MAG: zinc ribbon domain-containing protein [Anaerolineae bacterium]|nr:zinc ribbon domain-containing protein [Anaerolineae bacterium]